MKKIFLILITVFCINLKAGQILRLETDYYPGLGRVAITYLDQNKVLLLEDRNNCAFDNFGNPSICTEMAPSVTVEHLNLIQQSEPYSLYEFNEAKHLRLVTGKGTVKILKMNSQTGEVLLAVPMNKNYIPTPDFFRNNLSGEKE
jgi:hypothetical protein